jgi:ribonucleoside-diphosphate reductase beta chain
MSLLEANQVYKPFQYPWAMELAERHEKAHWGTWEVKLQEDVNEWKGNTLTRKEKNHITQILRLFTQSDVQVASNYCDTFIRFFKNNEIRNMLLSFAAREGTHQRAYALLNDTLGLPEVEYSTFLQYEEMVSKIKFMSGDTLEDAPILLRNVWSPTLIARQLALACINEGMSLFSAFIMLLNYQRFGKLKGMCEVVEWSIRDETLHVEGMTKLFRELCNEYPEIINDGFKKRVYAMVRKAVDLEDAVIDLAFAEGDIEGLCALQVKEYIRYLADRRLIQLGLKGNWGIKDNPLPWVDWIVAGDSFKNFFEGVVTDYSADGMKGNFGWDTQSSAESH